MEDVPQKSRVLNQRETETLLLFSRNVREPLSSQILLDIPLLRVVSLNHFDTYLEFEIEGCEAESSRPIGFMADAFGYTAQNNRFDIIVQFDIQGRLKELQYLFYEEDCFPEIDLSNVRFYDDPNARQSFFKGTGGPHH